MTVLSVLTSSILVRYSPCTITFPSRKGNIMKEVTKEEFKAIYLKYFKPDKGWGKGQWKKYYRKRNMRYFVRLPENSKEDRMWIVDGGNEVRLFFMTVDREEAFFDFPGKE